MPNLEAARRRVERAERRPLAIDLCCGLGGWARGFLEAGYDVAGFDVEALSYPGQLVVQDVRTLDGRRFRSARVIVASPPCQEFSRLDMPWTSKTANPNPDMSIVDACFRIAREAGVPLVLENVRGAKRFIPGDCWRWGGRYLWGDGVPLLRPEKVPPRGGKDCLKMHRKDRARERSMIEYPLARLIADYHCG